MKANKAITIALAGLLTACAIPCGTVFAAAESSKDYPVETTDEVTDEVKPPFECNLTFSEEKPITDYAVYGDKIAFASHTSVFVLETGENGDRKLDNEHPYSGSNKIERLDFDKSGNLYLDVKSDGIFRYPEYHKTVTYEFSEQGNTVKLSTDEEYRLSNDGLHYFFGDNHDVLGTDFSNLKVFGNKAYAVKENVLYTFTGNQPEAVDVAYTDFDEADNILCGDVASKLTAADFEIMTSEILAGKYCTKINPDVIGKDASDTFIALHTEKTNVDKPCIVLCDSGKTAVVATNDGMYITAAENLGERIASKQKNDWAIGSDGKRLAYANMDTDVYASPFMCKSTKIAKLESSAENSVEVTEKFEFGGVTFYRIKYNAVVKDENGEPVIDRETGNPKTEAVSGFVTKNVLTKYDFAAEDNDPHENGDKNFDYDTNVVSVVLAIVIVALVIVAIMYISLIGSKKNKDKTEKKEKKKREPEPVEEYNEDEE